LKTLAHSMGRVAESPIDWTVELPAVPGAVLVH
jgi:hypothetical protein